MKPILRFGLIVLLVSWLVLPVQAQTAEPIDLGATIEGQLDAEHASREYRFEAEAGDTVSITLLSDDFDPLVVLLDADGQELAYNDDGGPGSLNSRIGPYVLPDGGEYTIVANSYGNYFNGAGNDAATGAFTLILEQVNIRRIEYRQNVTGELTPTQLTAYFQFRGQAGDIINILAEGDGFSPTLSLAQMNTDALGSSLASGNDTSGQGVALIGGYVLQETDNYLIALTGSSGNTGSYTLEVETQQVTPLAYDEPLDIRFDAETPLAYLSFEAEAGDVVSLTVRGNGTLDTTLALNGPDGYQIAYADDTIGLDPRIEDQLLTGKGVYTVVVRPYSAGSTGDVTLTLEQGRLLTLDDGPQTLAMSSTHTREILTLSASAGDRVRLTIALAEGNVTSPNVEILQDNQSIAYGSGSNVERLSLDFSVPGDATLYVRIDDYSYAEILVDVTAESLGPGSPVVATEAPENDALMTPAAEALAESEAEDGLIEITEEPILEAATPEATAAG